MGRTFVAGAGSRNSELICRFPWKSFPYKKGDQLLNATARPALAVIHAAGLSSALMMSLLAGVLLASPKVASAQADPVGKCIEPTPEEREKYPNRLGCSDSDGGTNSMISFSGNPVRVMFACAVLCGGLGALGGSLVAQPNNPDANQWAVGAAGLTGAVLEIATLGNNWNPVAKGIIGGASGFALGWAVGTWNDQTTGAVAGSPESKAMPWAYIGAATAATTDVVVEVLDLNRLPLLRRLSRKSNSVQLLNTGRRMGMRVLW